MPAIFRLLLATVLTVALCGTSHAQEKLTPVSIGVFGFPSRSTPIPVVMAAHGFAKTHGLELTNKKYADGAAYYAGLVSGDVDVLFSGVGVLQSMINQGVPVRILATAAGMNAQVFSNKPDIRKVTDLRGKTLAATIAFSEFQNLGIASKKQGIDLLKDVKLMDAQPSDVLLQLKANRADAGLAWDPGAQILTRELPDLHVVADLADMWRQLTGLEGWELVIGVRQSWLDAAGPKGAKQLIDAMAAAQRFINENPAAAGETFKQMTGYPVELFEKVVRAKSFKFQVEPIWEGSHADEVYAQFRASTEAGYARRVPDKGVALYAPPR